MQRKKKFMYYCAKCDHYYLFKEAKPYWEKKAIHCPTCYSLPIIQVKTNEILGHRPVTWDPTGQSFSYIPGKKDRLYVQVLNEIYQPNGLPMIEIICPYCKQTHILDSISPNNISKDPRYTFDRLIDIHIWETPCHFSIKTKHFIRFCLS